MAKELDMNKYSRLFVTEARESLRVSNEAMLALESDPSNSEQLDMVFRNCHSIKGMAGMMSMQAITDTAHAIEDVLAAVRDGKLTPTGVVSETIFKGLDTLDSMVSCVDKGTEVVRDQGLIDALHALITSPPKAAPKKEAKASKKTIAKTSTTTALVKLGKKCSLPSARAMVIMKEIGKASAILESHPTEDEIEKEQVFEELSIIVEPGDRLKEVLKRVAMMPDVEQVLMGDSEKPKESWENISRPEPSNVSVATEASARQTVRVGMDKLDDLLDDVGELVIGRSRLLEKASTREDHELKEISMLIDKLTSDIQEKVLGIRMIPLDTVMSRYPRMVRDLAKAEGKEIELVVEGGDIELDRTVVDRITEPIMHLLRNCIDHGIETPEEREKQGKKPKGLIRVVASKQQDHVLIEVSDDGRGLDIEKIRSAAIRQGHMGEGEAKNALSRDLINLLFKPGFSTTSLVTEVSGRGVGLDVVKKNVEALGGTAMVNTSKGAGTTFSLWLPFTLAIIEAMLASIENQTYAIPIGTVVESHRYEEVEVKHVRDREVVQLRGEVLPLIRMREFFGLEKIADDRTHVNTLIVQSRDRRAALEVDELLGHQQIVVKSLDQRLRNVKGISGGTILGSGSIALILDVDSILGG